MPVVRKRKGRRMSPTNKRKMVLNENSSESNSEVKVENEFDNLFEEEADLTIKEDLQDIKLDLLNELNNFGNDSSSKSDNTSNGFRKVSTSLSNEKNSSNFSNSAKIAKIINDQKEAFKLIQSALVKFENVTKELQEMLEIDIEEEQSDGLENDLDPSFDSFQITEVEGDSSHCLQNSSENGLKNGLDSRIDSFQITEVEGESSHYWQNSSEKSTADSQTQEDEIREKIKECYSKEVPSNVSSKLINHSDKSLESSSSQISETQEKHKNFVTEKPQKTKNCVSKPNSSSKLPYVLLRKIDDVNTTLSPTPDIGVEHGAKTNFSQNARERVRPTPLNEEESTVNKEIVQNLQIARQKIDHGFRKKVIQDLKERVQSTPLSKEECTVNKEVDQNLQIARQSESGLQSRGNKISILEERKAPSPVNDATSDAASIYQMDLTYENPQEMETTTSSQSVDLTEEPNVSGLIVAANRSSKKSILKNSFRPCLFCGIQQTKLTRHIKSKHKSEPEVANALKLPEEERRLFFDLLRKRGISKANEESLKLTGKLKFSERRSKGGPYVKCSNCSGFYKKRNIEQHLKRCKDFSSNTSAPHYIPVCGRSCEDTEFNCVVKGKFRDDEIGLFIKEDIMLQEYGMYLYQKAKKNVEKKPLLRKNLMNRVRRIGKIFIHFKKVMKTHQINDVTTSLDLFRKEYFDFVMEAIDNMANSKLPGKQHIGYRLKAYGNFLKMLFSSDGNEDCFNKVNIFLAQLQVNWGDHFGLAKKSC